MPRVLDVTDPAQRADAVEAAVRGARNGRLVVLPAEAGYVLASDAFSAPGVAALQRLKGLPMTTSLGVLVGHAAGVHGIAARIPGAAQDLMDACWPGQLSLVLPMQRSLRWSVPTDRCVVRMPLHPLLLEVVTAVGPTVSSACSIDERDGAALVLDGGERPAGPGTTVVDATAAPLVLLREGAVPTDRLQAIVPDLVVER
jgi:L-threonylcarbamoyladenylate synthase